MSEVLDQPRSDLSLLAILRFLGRHMVIITIFVVCFVIAAIALAFTLTPKYRSEIIVFPASSSGGLGDLGGQLGGLASLAGINLPGAGGKKSDEALEFL